MDDVLLREATDEDVPAIAEIESLSFDQPWTREMILSEMREPLSHFFVAVLGGAVIGYYGFIHILDELHILNVAVSPDFRGRGVGTLLMKDLTERAYSLSARAVTLEVRQSNVAAIRLYERVGFVLSGVRPRYYTDKENALIYWLEL